MGVKEILYKIFVFVLEKSNINVADLKAYSLQVDTNWIWEGLKRVIPTLFLALLLGSLIGLIMLRVVFGPGSSSEDQADIGGDFEI